MNPRHSDWPDLIWHGFKDADGGEWFGEANRWPQTPEMIANFFREGHPEREAPRDLSEQELIEQEHERIVEQAALSSADSLAAGWDNPLDAQYGKL